MPPLRKIAVAAVKRGAQPLSRFTIGNPYLAGKLFPASGTGPANVVVNPLPPAADAARGEPVPPRELWHEYAETAEQFLDDGRRDVETMLRLLGEAGAEVDALRRVLDFGCAAGRMVRFYPHTPGESEIWGVDISAPHVLWCNRFLSPPYLFATVTTAPHLPFDDGYFDLVYAGSVFTHIRELADAWFLELRRVTRKGGYLFLTIHDEHTIDVVLERFPQAPLAATIEALDRETSFRSADYASVWTGTDPDSQVFYGADALIRAWSRFARFVSRTEEAYGYQTALVFQR
jgi:SAM-dependent methyltransferase